MGHPSPDPASIGSTHHASPLFRSARAFRGQARLAWTASAIMLGVCLLLTVRLQRDANTARRAYGETRPVWLIRHDVHAGAVLGTGDLERRLLPQGLVPASAIDADDLARSPLGYAVRTEMAGGEILLEHRLAGAGARGLSALLAPGTIGLALDPLTGQPDVSTGDQVLLFLLADASEGGSLDGARGGPDAVLGTVLAAPTSENRLVVAVDAADAGRVAEAERRGLVVMALLALGGGASPTPGSTTRGPNR